MNILEIGSGTSTALLSVFGQYLKANICSVDAREFSFNNVRCIKGSTVSEHEYRNFYDTSYLPWVEGLDIEPYISDKWDRRSWDNICREFLLDGSLEGMKAFLRDKSMLMHPSIHKLYYPGREHKYIDGDSALDIFTEPLSNEPTVMHLEGQIPEFDVLILDGGEFTGNIEYHRLKDQVCRGGYIILHDIYFPKSFKNFAPAAEIVSQPDRWEIIYQDRSTAQGLLIARRL